MDSGVILEFLCSANLCVFATQIMEWQVGKDVGVILLVVSLHFLQQTYQNLVVDTG